MHAPQWEPWLLLIMHVDFATHRKFVDAADDGVDVIYYVVDVIDVCLSFLMMKLLNDHDIDDAVLMSLMA